MSANRLGVSELIWRPAAARPDYLEHLLDGAAAAGYEGVLFFAATITPFLATPDEFRSLLEARNLSLVGVITAPSVDFAAVDRLSAWIAALHGEFLVLSGRCGVEDRDWSVVVPTIEHHGRISNGHGVRTVFHHHTGWIAETFAQTERLFAETDPALLRGMLDCGHATKDFVDVARAPGMPEVPGVPGGAVGDSADAAGAAAQLYRRHHQRIDYVEFKDWSPETDLRIEVGRGKTDWHAIAAALHEHDYRGWIVVEQNPPAADPQASSAESLRFIRGLLSQ